MLVILSSIASRFLRETSGTLHRKDPVCVLASDACNCISSSRVWHLRAVVCLVSSSKLFSICATLPSSHPPSWLVAAVYDNVRLSLDFEPTGLKLSTVHMRSDICWLCCRIILFFSSDDFSSASSRLRRFLSTILPRLPLPCVWTCSWRLVKCRECSSKLFNNFCWPSWNSEIVSFPSAMSLSACFNAALMTSRSRLVTLCRRARVWKCKKTFFSSAKWIGFCALLPSSQSVTTGAEVLSSEVAGRVSLLQEVGNTKISRFVSRSTCTQYNTSGIGNLHYCWFHILHDDTRHY